MQINRLVAIIALVGCVHGAVLADVKPETKTTPKDDQKKATTSTVVKDINTNITIGDVIAKDIKLDVTLRCMNFMDAVQNYKKQKKQP
jgi:hypothetical protein